MRFFCTLTLALSFPLSALAQSPGETMRLDLGAPSTTAVSPPAPQQSAPAPAPAPAPTFAAPAPQTTAQMPEMTAPQMPQVQAPTRSMQDSPQATAGIQMTESQLRTAQAMAQGNSDDKDHLIGCSIIYQRISDMYQDRGEREKSENFLRTAFAYSQTADILYTGEVGAEAAYDTITERMTRVADSLNRASQAAPDGDLGVIEQWLGWCDERGEFVQNTIDQFNSASE